MHNYYSDKVAVVTGAALGMGRAGAQAFAEAGAAVVLADVDEAGGQQAADALRAEGYEATFVRCDVADEAQVAAMIRTTVDTYGRLDAAFNNAGVQVDAVELPDVSDEDYDRVMAVNLRGVWNCMKHELIRMREQGSGAIVNNSSIGGLIGNPGRAAYHASKHAVLGLTKCAGLENAARGIRVNAVCPGTIDTPQVRTLLEREGLDEEFFVAKQPIARMGRPEEVAAAVVWLCSPGASLVVGHGLPVDGGYTAQ